MTTANITPEPAVDGILYANAVPVTPTEASLGDGLKTPTPISVMEGQSIVAVVKLTISGIITGNSTFVFLQTDLNGDGTWVDLAWCYWNGNQGTATFILTAGGNGAMNNAFQMSRQSSSTPASQANGSNACPLGGRVRFTGFSKLSGGSSAVPGLTSQVTATITFKLITPR